MVVHVLVSATTMIDWFYCVTSILYVLGSLPLVRIFRSTSYTFNLASLNQVLEHVFPIYSSGQNVVPVPFTYVVRLKPFRFDTVLKRCLPYRC